MAKATFDAGAFYSALDAQRQVKELKWKDVAREADVSSSTLTRLGQGRRPDVDSLAALCAWSGLNADDYLTGEKKGSSERLAAVSTLLRSDKNLSSQSAEALDTLIKTAYESFRKKEG